MSDIARITLILVGVLIGATVMAPIVFSSVLLFATPSNAAPPVPVATDSQWTRGPDMNGYCTYEYRAADNIRCYGMVTDSGAALSCVVLPTAPAPSP